MPIRINLLAEAQAAEEQRRKDPVKRAFYAGGFVVFLVVLWGTTLQLKIIAAQSDLGNLQSQWNSIETEYQEVVGRQRATIEAEEKLTALEALRTNRFLWGTALNALQQSLNGVDHVNVERLKTEQGYKSFDEPVPGATPGTPGATTTKVRERISITIEGKDRAPDPGSQVNRFKSVLGQVPFFRDNLRQTDGVRLTSRSAPAQDGLRGEMFVKFTIQCDFPEKVR